MEGRALFLAPDICRTIKERFVGFARNALVGSGYATEDAFWKKLADQGAHLGNSSFVCTAEGKFLGQYRDRDIRRCLTAWAALPEAARKAGAVRVEDREAHKPNPRNPQPPAGGLIIRTYMRALDRDGKGALFAPEKVSLGISKTVIKAEPNRDFLWLTREEWPALLPAQPRAGQTVAVLGSVRDRIARFHLVDGPCCLPGFWQPKEVQSADMMLTVTEASPKVIRAQLQGGARMQSKDRAVEFQLNGLLVYDPAKKVLTRFDMVAVSTKPAHKDVASGRLLSLGIAFELARSDSAADLRPPYRIWYDSHGPKDYFGTTRE
jgi:hypothetical protein